MNIRLIESSSSSSSKLVSSKKVNTLTVTFIIEANVKL